MTDDAEIVPLRTGSSAKPGAADWLAKLDRGDLTAEERAAFARWLAEDPGNRDVIKDLATRWYGLNVPLKQMAGGPQATARGTGRFMAAAAATSAMFVAVILFVHLWPTDAETGYFAAGIGETRPVTFRDGSEVILNTNSIVEQDFGSEERVIRLVSGEAIFDVAHDETRPFLVYAGDGVIRALGTRFSVRMEPERISVTVTEGRILLEQRPVADKRARPGGTAQAAADPLPDVEPVVVGQGEAGEIDRAMGASKRTVSELDVVERLSWTQGQLVFYDKELQSVIDEVTRYMSVEIRIEDEALKRKKITGILKIGDVDVMLDGIEGSLGVTVDRRSPDLVHLTSS